MITLLLSCQCYALPKLAKKVLNNRSSRLVIHDGIDRFGVVPKRHRILQHQQQRVYSTSLSSTNGNNQDTTSLSPVLSNETKNKMEAEMQHILTDVSSFDVIRTNNSLYVDKTKQIYDLILDSQKYMFLARPRGFGKTLLCSILTNLFLGKSKEELFKGLWIHDSKVWDFEKEEHPVIHLDMTKAAGSSSSVEVFESKLKLMLENIAEVNNIKVEPDMMMYNSVFFSMINQFWI